MQAADAQQLFYEGFELLKGGQAKEAAAKFEQGLKKDPSNATALHYLGEAYLAQGKKRQAKQRFQASLDADPNSAVAPAARARLAELTGRQTAKAEPAAKPRGEAAGGSSRPGTEIKDCPVCPELVVIPPGAFVMGSPPSETGRDNDEGPAHQVNIARPFALGKYEVTFDEWDACVAERACKEVKDEGWGRGRRPVINLDWEQALGYTEWLSQKTGKRYRLPSEAEWEYAARAGSEKARFWGTTTDRACQFANVYDQSGEKEHHWQSEGRKWSDGTRVTIFDCDDGYPNTAPVGSFQPNGFGLYDILGNVWEWTEDCSNSSYAGAPVDGSPWRTGDCGKRVDRGGGWNYSPQFVRSAFRFRGTASNRYGDLGFRVARTLP